MYHVLYVDDEPNLLAMTKHFLEKSKEFTIDTAISAEELLEAGNLSSYDIIVSDYQMPGMDGIEFLQEVRSKFGDIPFIIFTGRGREEVVIEAINSGVDFYIQKGGDPKSQFAELMHKIRMALRRRHAEEEEKESEKRYRAVVEDQTELICRFTPDGRLTFVNNAYCRYFNLEKDQCLTRHHLVELRPEDALLMKHHLASLTPDNPVALIEHCIRMTDGTIRWQRWNDRAIFGNDGQIIEYQSVGRDITERKKTEEALKASKDYVEQLIETANAMIVGLDNNGNILLFNSTAENVTGYCREELSGKSWFEFLVPKDRYPFVLEEFNRILAGGLPKHFENPIRTKSGEERYIIWKNSEIRQNEKIVGTISFGIDITERKQAEQALKESETMFREFFNNAGDAIAIHNLNGRFLEVNDVICKRLGYSREEMLQMSPGDVDEPEYGKIVQDRIHELLQAGQIVFETVHRAKDGTLIPTEVSSRVITFHGEPAVLSSARDITERKRAEEALKLSEEQYRTIIDNMQDMFYRTDNEGRFTMISPSGARLVGYDNPDQMIGVNIDKHWVTPSERKKFLEKLRNDGSVTNYPVAMLSLDGKVHHLMVNSHLYKDRQGALLGVEGIIHDVTDLRLVEDGLRLANKKLNLLSGITRHDIHNQLMVLKGYLSLSAKYLDNPGELSAFISKEEKAVDTIERQIGFTKDYENLGIEAPSWQNLVECIDNSKALLPMKEVHFTNKAVGIEIFADPLLEKVFYNLFDNALRYGGESLTNITVESREEGGSLVLSVDDNGRGINPEDKAQLFVKGFGKNTGLGLFLSREILSITGITISETGIPGNGARFEIVAPKGRWRLIEEKQVI